MNIPELYTQVGLHIQTTDFSCGPCAVMHVVRLCSDNPCTEEELIEACQSHPEVGSDHNKVAAVLGDFDVTVHEVKKEGTIQDLEQHLNADRVVLVNYYNTFAHVGHFAVIVNHDDDAFYFFDSALGLMRLHKEYFAPVWHNNDKTLYGWFAAVS